MKVVFLNRFILIALTILNCGCDSDKQKSNSENTEEQSTDNSRKLQGEEKNKSVWTFAKVVDEFGDEVKGDSVIIGVFDGRMSNSVTTDANVIVKIQLSKDKKSYITFYEYGNTLSILPDKEIFNIKIKKSDDSTEFIEQFSINNMLVDTKGVLLERILSQNEPLKVNVDLSRANHYDKAVFNFEIDPSGLSKMLD